MQIPAKFHIFPLSGALHDTRFLQSFSVLCDLSEGRASHPGESSGRVKPNRWPEPNARDQTRKALAVHRDDVHRRDPEDVGNDGTEDTAAVGEVDSKVASRSECSRP